MDDEALRAVFGRRHDVAATAYREMVAVVGEVAQAGARFEGGLRRLMASLLDSKYGALVTAGLGVSELIDTCTVLVKANEEITDDAREKGLALLSGARELINIRNALVHGLIATSGSAGLEADELVVETIAIVSKRRRPDTAVKITRSEAEETAAELRSRALAIFAWQVTHLPGPLQRKQVTPWG